MLHLLEHYYFDNMSTIVFVNLTSNIFYYDLYIIDRVYITTLSGKAQRSVAGLKGLLWGPQVLCRVHRALRCQPMAVTGCRPAYILFYIKVHQRKYIFFGFVCFLKLPKTFWSQNSSVDNRISLQKKLSGKWTLWLIAFHTCNKIIWFKI